jgi:hypothetical protein
MRNILAPFLLILPMVACREPKVQPFGPPEPPTPAAPQPTPTLYRVEASELGSEPVGNSVRLHIMLEVTNDTRPVAGASVYLWGSTGTLAGSGKTASDPTGKVELLWDVPVQTRAILSACATQPAAPPCMPTVIMRRDT